MSARVNTIREQALSLPPEERERLYEALLVSLDGRSDQDHADFIAELRERRKAFVNGELTARPFDKILIERLRK
ncbi:MAG: addiction module protein [Chitinophagales bacterium]|nr:addiction module protein [Hyphomicrobiales bacterium]